MNDHPGLLLCLTLWAYWLQVLWMAWRRSWRQGRASGLLPKSWGERLLWPFWVPVIVGWNALPWLALTSHKVWLMLPEWYALRWAAAGVGVACYLLTVHCWRRMGQSWSVAVVPQARTELVRTGLYAFVRHPIYALSLAFMFCSVLVVPTWPMLALAAVHGTFMWVKVRGEERFLLAMHGPAYADYCRRTGRFLPRWS
jgi:protein-S-isoprenylcysteine O-methyltransferase Ste14